jgi:hypothetical protein
MKTDSQHNSRIIGSEIYIFILDTYHPALHIDVSKDVKIRGYFRSKRVQRAKKVSETLP